MTVTIRFSRFLFPIPTLSKMSSSHDSVSERCLEVWVLHRHQPQAREAIANA